MADPYWPLPFPTRARIWSSVVVDDQNVYAASQDHFLYAINKKSGKQVWKFPGDGTDIDALVGSPTLHEGTVYVGSFGGVLYAVDAATGQLKWSFKAEGGLWDGPAMIDGTLYFGDQAGNVYALDAATGQNKKWSAKVEGGVKMTPLVDNGVVYVGTDRDRMYAFKADTGQTVWAEPYKAREGENLMVTPTIYNTTLVVLPNLAGANPHTPDWTEQEHRPGNVAVSRQAAKLRTVRNRVLVGPHLKPADGTLDSDLRAGQQGTSAAPVGRKTQWIF